MVHGYFVTPVATPNMKHVIRAKIHRVLPLAMPFEVITTDPVSLVKDD
jgi:hypothetical protein